MEENKDKIIIQDPLSLDIDDDKFADVIQKRIEASKKYFDEQKHLKDRVEKNEKYYFGRQIKPEEMKNYEGKWLDNVIWESEKNIKAVALSKLPDLIVKPGSDVEDSKSAAEQLSKVVDTDIKRRERRQVLALAFKHLPVYFRGVIKYRWDPEIGENGDYIFEVVHPKHIVVDHTSPSNDQKDMDFIAQELELSIKEAIMRFPDKKAEIIEAAKKDGVQADEKGDVPEAQMATKVKVWEIWFTWYDKTENGEYERVEGVAWKYHNKILKKIKNPNWDWKGQKRTFKYDVELKEEEVRDVTIPMAEGMMQGEMVPGEIPGLRTETFYNNYFESPEKPFIFINSELWGDSPIDETSRVEQLVLMQYTLDNRGKTIAEKLTQRIKHVFSKEGGLKAEDIEEMDLNNPDEDILVDGDVNKVHSSIPPEMPTAQEMKDYEDTRNRMFAKAGTFATRGEVQTDVATSNQIAREADFTRADDLVEETINYAAEKMARAVLQMIKLRYTEDHYARILGDDGKVVFQRVHRDMVEDGMEVQVTASGTDKIKAERRAMDMAKLQLIDPFTFYKDIGASDPKGRTEKLMLFMSSPEQYMAQVVMGLKDTNQMATALNGPGGGQQAMMDIQMMTQGQMPPVPQNVDAEYLDTLTEFMQSPEFQALPPEVQAQIGQFAQQILSMVDQQSQAQAQPGQQFGQPKGATGTPVNPSAGNTSSVPTQAPQLAQGSPRNL